MRKFLLSTSALAGAALLSSAAIADVNISGTVEWEMITGDTDILLLMELQWQWRTKLTLISLTKLIVD